MHNKSSFHQCQPPIVPRYGPHQAEKLSPKSSVRHDPATRDSYSRTSSSRNPPISPYLTGSTLLPATRKVARAHLRATPIPFFSTQLSFQTRPANWWGTCASTAYNHLTFDTAVLYIAINKQTTHRGNRQKGKVRPGQTRTSVQRGGFFFSPTNS